MIPLKLWNSFTQDSRIRILNYTLGSNWPSDLAREYHHPLTQDDLGKQLKQVLKHCYEAPDHEIKITIQFRPIIVPTTTKTLKAKERVSSNYPRKWIIDYEDSHGDLSHAWCKAYSRSEALDYFKSEYHDIHRILTLYPETK